MAGLKGGRLSTMSGSNASDPSRRPPDRRKLIAVVYADMVGYSRLIGLDDVGTLERLRTLRRNLLDPAIEEHGGRLVQTGGDSLLIVFDSIDGALRCSMNVQQQVPDYDRDQPPDRAILFRVGINIGDAIADGTDLHGDAVNIAARLQAECPPGGICVSRSVRDHVQDRLNVTFEELGLLDLKNIARPVEAFVVRLDGAVSSKAIVRSLVHGSREALPLPSKPSIAVLAFTNMSGDPDQEHFSDGIADDIITELSRCRWLFVVARNSSFTYKGHAVHVRQVSRELGVRYILEGSVRRGGDRVRVTAQLIEGETDTHVWAERYDRALEDVFAVQDEITNAVTVAIGTAIADAEQQRAMRKPPENLGAWELYHRGMWYLLRRNRENITKARALLGEAISLDPNFPTAHAAFAVSSFWLITHGITTDGDETRSELLKHATNAVNLDLSDSLAHSAMGLAYMETGEHDKAIASHANATTLNPNSSFGQWCFGYALNPADRYLEALERSDLALRLSPRDAAVWSYLTLRAAVLYNLGDYEAALAAARQATGTQVVELLWPLVHMAASLGGLHLRGGSGKSHRESATIAARADDQSISCMAT
jgi:adenylate cyclase